MQSATLLCLKLLHFAQSFGLRRTLKSAPLPLAIDPTEIDGGDPFTLFRLIDRAFPLYPTTTHGNPHSSNLIPILFADLCTPLRRPQVHRVVETISTTVANYGAT